MNEPLKRIRQSIERRIEEWHNSDAPLSLCEYLGWTPKEYTDWLEEQKIPVRELGKLS